MLVRSESFSLPAARDTVVAMGDLDADTRLDGADGRYRAVLSPEWRIWGPNGGYLAAIALRAAGAEARVRRPATFAAHYLAVAEFGPVDLAVTAVQRGRRAESFRVSMSQRDRPILEALVRTAAEGPGLAHDTAPAPAVPGPDTLRNARELYGRDPVYPFWLNVESRPIAEETWAEGRPPRDPVVREWFRFQPTARFADPFVDAGRLLVLLDTMIWPASCQRHPAPAFLAPSIDVTAWLHRSASASEWLFCEATAPVADGGLIAGTSRVWDAGGRLVATGDAQLLCVPPPAA
jgi:acyl-CoA thioesterase-2